MRYAPINIGRLPVRSKLMRSLLRLRVQATARVVCVVFTAVGSTAHSSLTTSSEDPDSLYKHRQDLASAARAADAWAARAVSDFDASWKLSRACYWLGTHAPQGDRRTALNRGIDPGESGVRLMPE